MRVHSGTKKGEIRCEGVLNNIRMNIVFVISDKKCIANFITNHFLNRKVFNFQSLLSFLLFKGWSESFEDSHSNSSDPPSNELELER